MKAIHVTRLWLCRLAASSLLLLVFGSVALRAQAAQNDFVQLTYTVAVLDRQLLVFEPIPVTLRLKNETDQPIVGHDQLQFSAHLTTLFVQPEGSAPYEITNLSIIRSLVERTSVPIRPGKMREVEELLTFGLDEAFPSPGRYTIQFVLHSMDRKQEIRSNSVVIQLRAPTGLEQRAQQYIERSGAARMFFRSIDDRFYDILAEVAANFAMTPYSDYANLLLGEHSARLRDYGQARLYLAQVAAKTDFPLRQRAATLLAQLQAR